MFWSVAADSAGHLSLREPFVQAVLSELVISQAHTLQGTCSAWHCGNLRQSQKASEHPAARLPAPQPFGDPDAAY